MNMDHSVLNATIEQGNAHAKAIIRERFVQNVPKGTTTIRSKKMPSNNIARNKTFKGAKCAIVMKVEPLTVFATRSWENVFASLDIRENGVLNVT